MGVMEENRQVQKPQVSGQVCLACQDTARSRSIVGARLREHLGRCCCRDSFESGVKTFALDLGSRGKLVGRRRRGELTGNDEAVKLELVSYRSRMIGGGLVDSAEQVTFKDLPGHSEAE